MLREGTDLPKVMHSELEANLEPGSPGPHWLLFSLQSGCPPLRCFRHREPLQRSCRGVPVPCLSESSSNPKIAILLATAHSCTELYSLQLARLPTLHAISHLIHLATLGSENYYPHFTSEESEASKDRNYYVSVDLH